MRCLVVIDADSNRGGGGVYAVYCMLRGSAIYCILHGPLTTFNILGHEVYYGARPERGR